ncbi:hypothetical protein [Roseateles sp.]|jgi:hypothetical protein|uniref:hypothetical protein n=1 Tax=Roseateles sp. TaxID=1971397 RepID=UPI003919359D
MNFSLKDLERLQGRPVVRAAMRRELIRDGVATYGEFVDQLYEDIDAVIFNMQSAPELRQNDCEDRLSGDILHGLRQQGYKGYPDVKSGGHVDLTIELGPYTWFGEAKKDGNFDQGLLQLMSRYRPASGNFSHDQGGLIFYMVATPKARDVLNKWLAKLHRMGLNPWSCCKNRLAGFSVHENDATGMRVTVRTMAVALYFKPQDTSGLKTVKRKAAKAAKASPSVEGHEGPTIN